MILTHPSGERIDTAMIDRMLAQAGGTDAVDYRTSTRRDAIRQELVRLGVKLQDVRASYTQLDAGFDYLNEQMGMVIDYDAVSPDLIAREDILIEWIHGLAACERLQEEIRDAVLRGEAA